MCLNHVYVRLFWIGLLGLLLVSLVPDVKIDRTVIDVGIEIHQDHVLHFVGYAVLGWLCGMAYRVSVKSVCLLVLFAGVNEAVQYFVDGRTVNVLDVVSNVLGLSLGLLFVVITGSRARAST